MVESAIRQICKSRAGNHGPKVRVRPTTIPKQRIRMMSRCTRGKPYVTIVSCDGFCGIDHTHMGIVTKRSGRGHLTNWQ